jgi:hypothetical protein
VLPRVRFQFFRDVLDREVDEGPHAHGQEAMPGVDEVNWQILRVPLRQDAHKLPGEQVFPNQKIRKHGYPEPGSHRFPDTSHTFGNQHRRKVERLFDPAAGEKLDILCTPELITRMPKYLSKCS